MLERLVLPPLLLLMMAMAMAMVLGMMLCNTVYVEVQTKIGSKGENGA